MIDDIVGKHLSEKGVDMDSTISAHVANEVQRAYEILEALDDHINKMVSKMPDINPKHNKAIQELSDELRKMMHKMDVAKVMKFAERVGR